MSFVTRLLLCPALIATAAVSSVHAEQTAADINVNHPPYASPAQHGLSITAPIPGTTVSNSEASPAALGDPEGAWSQSRDQTRGAFSGEYNNRTTTNNASAATANSSSAH